MKPKALAGPNHSVGPGPYGSLPPTVALGLRASVEFGALIRKVVVSGRALSVCRPLPGSCGRDATVREVRGSFERFSSIAGALEAGTRERLARCYITVVASGPGYVEPPASSCSRRPPRMACLEAPAGLDQPLDSRHQQALESSRPKPRLRDPAPP